MASPVRILGAGRVVDRQDGPGESAALSARLAEAAAAVARSGRRIRLFHRIEEMALLSAWEALAEGGFDVPLPEGERMGIALGIEEGIDGIKARHAVGYRSEGLLGVSPLAFPFTAPNSVTAQVSIALDIRGEALTLCGGQLSGAAAVGIALGIVRQGRRSAMMAGGATSADRVFLDGLAHAGVPPGGAERAGAGILLLAPLEHGMREGKERTPLLLGYGEGFGRMGMEDALGTCLEDAGISLRDIDTVWEASPDGPFGARAFPGGGSAPAPLLSPAADLFSASFPMAIAEAVNAPGRNGGLALIVGTDCLGGAAAAVVGGMA